MRHSKLYAYKKRKKTLSNNEIKKVEWGKLDRYVFYIGSQIFSLNISGKAHKAQGHLREKLWKGYKRWEKEVGMYWYEYKKNQNAYKSL